MDTKTIETYNQLANEYDQETITFWEEFPRTFLDHFIDLSGHKILDLGSGPGRDGLLLQTAGKDVTCLDASPEMIRLSSDRGLNSVLADFMAAPFESESFDGIWAYTSLLHIPKSEIGKALTEVYRLLKPEGIFGLGMIEGNEEKYRESSGVNLPRWFSFYTAEELNSLAQTANFELVYSEIFKPRTKNYLHFILKKK